MTTDRDPNSVADERLSRLGREWYDEVRRKNPDETRTRKESGAGSDGGGFFDWLFGSSDDGSGDSGGCDGD